MSNDLGIPDPLLLDMVSDVESSLTRRKYEEFLVRLGLYGLSDFEDGSYFTRHSKHDLIVETLRGRGQQKIIEALCEQRILRPGTREALAAYLRDDLAPPEAVEDAFSLELRDIEPEISQPSERAKADLGAAPPAGPELYGIGNRWCVLVGIDAYDAIHYPSLDVCTSDIERVRETLVNGGFETDRMTVLTDKSAEQPIRVEIYEALELTAAAAQPDDLVLFYFSGHGDVDDSVSYLIAGDSRSSSLKHTAVSLVDVTEILRTSKARAKVIVLDACHSGANFDGKGPKPMPQGFIRRVFEQAKGEVILASCQRGQLSYVWQEKGLSVFTYYMVAGLTGDADRDSKGFVTVQDINRFVADGVTKWAFDNKRTQRPTMTVLMSGDIILTRH